MKMYKAVAPEIGDRVVVERGDEPGFSGEGVVTYVPRNAGHRFGIRIGSREEYILSNNFYVKGYKGYDNYN